MRLYEVECVIDSDNPSENQAWVAGFFGSDGSLHNDSRSPHIYIFHWTQHKQDLDAVQKLRKILHVGNPIKFYNDRVVLRFRSEEYESIFKEWDLKKQIHPVFMKENLNRHYLRGLVDGDGCLHSGKHSKQVLTFINENERVVQEFSYSVHKYLGIKFKTPKYVEKHHLWKIIYQTREARLLSWYLYHGNIHDACLSRKYMKYLNFVESSDPLNQFIECTFGLEQRYKPAIDKTGVYLPMTQGPNTDSLQVCKMFQMNVGKFGIKCSIVPRKKGQKKYYGLYMSHEEAQNIKMLRPYLHRVKV